jgi:chaperone modulatory protein CbpM
MIGFDELVRRFAGIEAAEFSRWVENRWIVPERENGPEAERWAFHEVDVARIELILHIRREFALDEETTSLVLGLLDQVYSLRRQMRRLCHALESQPPEVREAIQRALPATGEAPRRSSEPRASRPPRGRGRRSNLHSV